MNHLQKIKETSLALRLMNGNDFWIDDLNNADSTAAAVGTWTNKCNGVVKHSDEYQFTVFVAIVSNQYVHKFDRTSSGSTATASQNIGVLENLSVKHDGSSVIFTYSFHTTSDLKGGDFTSFIRNMNTGEGAGTTRNGIYVGLTNYIIIHVHSPAKLFLF